MNVGVSSSSGSGGPEREYQNGVGRPEKSESQVSTTQQPAVQTSRNQNAELAKASIASSSQSDTSKPSFLKTALLSGTTYTSIGTALTSVAIIAPMPFSLYSASLILLTLGYPLLALKSIINEHKELSKNADKSVEQVVVSATSEINKASLFRRTQGVILLSQATLLLTPTIFNFQFDTGTFRGFYDSVFFGLSALGSFAAGASVNEYTKTEKSLVDNQNSFGRKLKILFLANPGASWILADTLIGLRAIGDLGIVNLVSNTKALGFLALSLVPFIFGARSIYKQVVVTDRDAINRERVFACAFSAVQLACLSLFNFSVGHMVVGFAMAIYVASTVVTGRQIYLSSKLAK